MPFPINLESLLAAGYVFLRSETCPACQEPVEVFTTPGKRELAMQPMCELLRPAVRHYETCNIAQKQEEQSGDQQLRRAEANGSREQINPVVHDSHADELLGEEGRDRGIGGSTGERVLRDGVGTNDRVSASVQREGVQRTKGADGARIKLYGVTDPNHQLLAVGWDDGVLVCQFKTAKWGYAGVPEAEFVKLKRAPYAYRIFTTNIKGKYPATKME